MQDRLTTVVSPRIVVAPSASASGGDRERRLKPCQRRPTPKPMRITDRDLDLLASLAQHRFLSGEQLGRLFFPGTDARRVRRRCRILFDHGLINRVAVTAQPTRGVPNYLYVLTDTGAELVSASLGRPAQAYRLAGRRLISLCHQHLVNDFFVTMTQATRRGSWQLEQWKHEWALKVSDGKGGRRAERIRIEDPDQPQAQFVTVLPDAYFTLQQDNGQTHAFFFELDLSTHSLRRWRQRAFAFTNYADPDKGNRFQRRFGHPTFRVLVVTPRDQQQRRTRNIVRTIEKAVGRSQLFLVTSLDQLTPDNGLIHAAIWHRVGGQRPGPMIQLSKVVVRKPTGSASGGVRVRL